MCAGSGEKRTPLGVNMVRYHLSFYPNDVGINDCLAGMFLPYFIRVVHTQPYLRWLFSAFMSTTKWQEAAMVMAPRWQFFDDLLKNSVEKDDIRQIILLGGGYSTQILRNSKLLERNKVTVFHIDLPKLTESYISTVNSFLLGINNASESSDTLSDICPLDNINIPKTSHDIAIEYWKNYVKFISGDLNTDWESKVVPELLGLGLNINTEKILIIFEAVAQYLQPQANEKIFEFIAQKCPKGSKIGWTSFTRDSTTGKTRADILKNIGEPVLFSLDSQTQVEEWHKRFRLSIKECITSADLIMQRLNKYFLKNHEKKIESHTRYIIAEKLDIPTV
ncbi:hypothetical protein RFI_03419 [Reticulomyxa filosa]|uniref:Leucine carboxyl methyltransferase n=1 Tax=Reticulomyxa filosa TaxID=46433 RepID=X6P660_RETFI|nr:hypothetical protein RFI_03419 [Reticulomyxa filosa]|eukprot:ETO33681.1 hypothetical protein RFI_03419 [Reticulomyxa filosa]